jgi:hypothetical protein
MAANATAGPDTINLPALPAGTKYTLTLTGSDPGDSSAGDLDITDALTIQGGGAATTIIDDSGLTVPMRLRSGSASLAGWFGETLRNSPPGSECLILS